MSQFHIAQSVLARLLHLRPSQLTLPNHQQQSTMLSTATGPAVPLMRVASNRPTLKIALLGIWSARTGYHPHQPDQHLANASVSWAEELSKKAQTYGRGSWALFEVQESSAVIGGLKRTHYWLVPMLDVVHHYAEQHYLPATLQLAA